MVATPASRRTAERTAAGRTPSRPLLIFWGGFAGIVLIGIGVLQYLGPPKAPANTRPANTAAAPPAAPAAPTPMAAMGTGSSLPPGHPIPAPMPALLAPSAANPAWLVPHIGPDGLTPMRAYSAGAVPGAGPHVAILVAGIGDDETESEDAVRSLPAAVSLALTPYGQHSTGIAALAREAGHETLLAIPMQEADPASQNAGNEALVTAAPITQDLPMLDWSLSRFAGYAGVTDAIGATQGAGFMNNADARSWLLQEIADKGLFFIGARPAGPAPYAWNRTADVIIDPVNAPEKESAQLAALAADARQQGNALGILLNPAPAALQTLAAWTRSLSAQGITLEPVSALVLPPDRPATAN